MGNQIGMLAIVIVCTACGLEPDANHQPAFDHECPVVQPDDWVGEGFRLIHSDPTVCAFYASRAGESKSTYGSVIDSVYTCCATHDAFWLHARVRNNIDQPVTDSYTWGFTDDYGGTSTAEYALLYGVGTGDPNERNSSGGQHCADVLHTEVEMADQFTEVSAQVYLEYWLTGDGEGLCYDT